MNFGVRLEESVFVVAGVNKLSDKCMKVTLGTSWKKTFAKGEEAKPIWGHISWYVNGEEAVVEGMKTLEREEGTPAKFIKLPKGTRLAPDNWFGKDKATGDKKEIPAWRAYPPKITEENKDDASARVEILANATSASAGDANVPW